MSGYNGRRGVNVSQYINNLNTIPGTQDYLEPLNEDFDAFFQADLLELDPSPPGLDLNQTLDLDSSTPDHGDHTLHASGAKDLQRTENTKQVDFLADFQFTDFSYPNPVVDTSMHRLPHSQPNQFSTLPSYTPPVSVTSLSPVTPQFSGATGKKRKADHVEPHSQQAIDEEARIAAEEDKRRRNTAASARFRVKKKQREQQLEKTAKEAQERVAVLETRISQLEMENNWLKGLITEKNEKADVSAMYRKHVEEHANERSSGNRNDGVGTAEKEQKAKA